METDAEQLWEQCPFCEYVWDLKPDWNRPPQLRFVDHSRSVPSRGRPIKLGCPGSLLTVDEAWEKRRNGDQ